MTILGKQSIYTSIGNEKTETVQLMDSPKFVNQPDIHVPCNHRGKAHRMLEDLFPLSDVSKPSMQIMRSVEECYFLHQRFSYEFSTCSIGLASYTSQNFPSTSNSRHHTKTISKALQRLWKESNCTALPEKWKGQRWFLQE